LKTKKTLAKHRQKGGRGRGEKIGTKKGRTSKEDWQTSEEEGKEEKLVVATVGLRKEIIYMCPFS
jgi:hypothetical protein